MTRPVSIVLPSLGTTDLLERSLPPLLEELGRRATGDEAILVDDTGRDELRAWAADAFPSVRVVVREENGGFGPALRSGAEEARHDLFFSMNTDVLVRPGFLDPLVAAMDEDVAAAVPRVLLDGDEERIESWTGFELRAGRIGCRMRGLDADEPEAPSEDTPVAFAVGGTCLFRTAGFLEGGGFDAMYEPFYWEDVDYCWSAWRRGRRVLYVPFSVVEHHHRGTIEGLVPEEAVRAAIEKNTLLFHWKHLDDPALLRRHLAEVRRAILAAWVEGRTEELVWLVLALDQADAALAAREGRPPATRTVAQILAASR